MPAEYDVFLSHNSRDKPVVQKIGTWLQARGLRVFLDKWELRPGFPWQEGLESGIEASKAGAVFVGAEGLGDWQTPEMRAFIARSRRGAVPVIPVLLPGCPQSPNLPLFLEAFTWVDLRDGVTDESLEVLVWGITGVKPQGLSEASLQKLHGTPARSLFLHNLPYRSLGDLFQGREEWLERLHRSLHDNPQSQATAIAGQTVQGIHSLGGVGKTRLAVEYAWRYADEYRAAFFVGADSPAQLRTHLAALAGPELLDLPEREAPEEEVREIAVLRWLRESTGWLLILDNIDSEDAAEAVDSLLSRLQGGNVLLTGRLSKWSPEIEDVRLDLLEEKDAVAFLLARTERGRRRSGDPEEEEARAREIARELDRLPLALEQAGAYIVARRLTFAEYLKEWREQRQKLLEALEARISHYPASVAVTWQTSVDQLTEPARRLLRRLAWLGPEPIPEFLLEVPTSGATPAGRLFVRVRHVLSAFLRRLFLRRSPLDRKLAQTSNPLDLLLELGTYSLVTRSSEAPAFTVHRLVQEVTRRGDETKACKKALLEALAWVDQAFVGDAQDVRTWPRLEPLAPHARAVVTSADEAEISEPTARLMNDLAVLYQAKALPAEAEPLIRRALHLDVSRFGPDHPNVAIRLNNLAQLLKATNRLAEAEPLMRRSLHIDESGFGARHPNVARDLSNLALLLKAQSRLAEAEPLLRRALHIDESSLGTEHPKVAIRLNNLAGLLQATNRLDEAEPLMQRVVAILETNLGEDHPDVAIALNNLALLLQDRNRLNEAEPLMRRAGLIFLDFTRRTGFEHPQTANVLGNYAGLLDALGRSEDEIETILAGLIRSENTAISTAYLTQTACQLLSLEVFSWARTLW